MMSGKNFVEAYLDGDASLAETFTTGFRRDMHLAREIIRRRRNDRRTAGDRLSNRPPGIVDR
ncbi:MAG: hypothetical protein QNJ14_03690 [Woeseiaceae bacterium]|nr:hypothetical protein [Woeseiaceae bacterium]